MKHSLRQHLVKRCSSQELARWYDPLRLNLREEERRLVVVFPHAFFADWFRGTVQDLFEEEIAHFFGPGYTLAYEVAVARGNGVGLDAPPMATRTDFPFGREFTFDTFLGNKKNFFPVASAKAVAKNQDCQYNPLCLCGESGTGKTHLLRAMANEISKTVERNRIFLGSLEDIAALFKRVRRGEQDYQPRQAMAQYSHLFVDDFHRVGDDHDLQEALVPLINYFHDERRQMVFTFPDKITACDYLHPALKSRMEGGLVVLLARQDVDIRARYVQRMAETKKLRLSKEQMLTLAQRFEDFRFLQGILLKLSAFRELAQREITEEDFKRILEYTENRPEARLSAEDVQSRVAEHFGLASKDLVGDSRQQNIVFARQVAMFLCREMLGASYPALGRLFGGKDHSTAMYAVRKIARLQGDNKDVRNLIQTLKKACS